MTKTEAQALEIERLKRRECGMNEAEAVVVESFEVEDFTLFCFPVKTAYACGSTVSVPAVLVRPIAEDNQVVLCQKSGAWAAIRFTMGYAVFGDSVMLTPRRVSSIYHKTSAGKMYRDLWHDGFYAFTIGDLAYTYRVEGGMKTNGKEKK